jgi:hypothetical protein
MHGLLERHESGGADNNQQTTERKRKPQKRRPRKQRQRFQKGSVKNVIKTDHPDRVFTFAEWIEFNSISEDTGRRILASGAIEILQLSANRIGIRASANHAWQNSLVRK